MQKLSVILLLINIAFAMCSCTQWPWQQKIQISVQATVDANDNMATALDIVFVYEENLAAELPKTSPEWFANKAAFMSKHSALIEIAHIEVPPGMSLQTIAPPVRHQKTKAVIAFANYIPLDGQFAANLMPFKCVTITLKHDAVAYDECR